MKKAITFLLMGIMAQWSNAQAYPRFGNDHEVKFNIGLFLAANTVEGSYEYYFSEDTSIGGTLYFDNIADDYNGNFGFGPNLRAYFGYLPRSGFFAEAFGLYYKGRRNPEPNADPIDRNFNTMALGLGVGKKWVTRNEKFSLEINGGLGRNINQEAFQDLFIFRAGFSMGFRF